MKLFFPVSKDGLPRLPTSLTSEYGLTSNTAGFKVLIQSPDIDRCQVGLPLATPQMEVVVQLSHPVIDT